MQYVYGGNEFVWAAQSDNNFFIKIFLVTFVHYSLRSATERLCVQFNFTLFKKRIKFKETKNFYSKMDSGDNKASKISCDC